MRLFAMPSPIFSMPFLRSFTQAGAVRYLLLILAFCCTMIFVAPTEARAANVCVNTNNCTQNSNTFGAFTIEFVSVTCNGSTSTWTYRIKKNSGGPALSHLVIGICEDIISNPLVNPGTQVVFTNDDPTTGVHGIKFDSGSALVSQLGSVPLGTFVNFSFTLNTTDLTVGPVFSATKAGGNIGNNTICGPACPQAPTPVEMISFGATKYQSNEAVITWKTANDVNNLGYHLYRQQGGKRIRITQEVIAGTALLTGTGVTLAAGRSYSWKDKLPKGKKAVQYWIEELDLSGQRTFYGPILPESAVGEMPDTGKAPILLSQLNEVASESQTAGYTVETAQQRATMPEISIANRDLSTDLAALPAAKLKIKQTGWYSVSQAELVAAGFDASVNPRNLQLFVDGKQVSIRVTGEQDGTFDTADAVEFYGLGLDSPYTGSHVYWLVAGGQAGARINNVRNASLRAPATSFQQVVTRKDRIIYFAALLNGETSNFFGSVVTNAAIDQLLPVHSPSANSSATLDISLQGASLGEHQVRVLLNGTEIGTVSFTGQSKGSGKLDVPQGLLKEGDNVINLVSLLGSSDITLVDYLRLYYEQRFHTNTDSLFFSLSGGQRADIGGFTAKSIRVMDVTNPDAVQEISARLFGTTVSVSLNGSSQRQLLAFSERAVQTVAGIELNQPSNWRSADRTADLVIISHAQMADAVAPLVALRQSEGMAVAVVDVEDIYDEFNNGHKSPQAIKSFLAYTRAYWQKAPAFVLLVGDATFDPRNYLGGIDDDFVPSKLIDTQFLETVSDEWFVDLQDDGHSQMAIGRLPVRSAAEAATVIGKIVSSEQAISTVPPRNLFIADRNDGINFEEHIASLKALLPPSVEINEVYRSQMDDATAKAAVLNYVNAGQRLVTYSGHGSVTLWNGNLLTTNDVRTLTNHPNLPVFMMMNCLNGFFQSDQDSLAEALLKAPQGGAAAVWASSALTFPQAQVWMSQEFYRQVLSGSALRLGEAIQRAKAGLPDADVRNSWVLFGDPTMRLRLER